MPETPRNADRARRGELERDAWTRLEAALGGRILRVKRVNKRSAGAAMCTLCLTDGRWEDGMTAAHVFNKQERDERPPRRAPWYDRESDVAGFRTPVIMHSAEQGTERLNVGGKWSVLRGMTVPICEKCRKLEEKLDAIAQRPTIVRFRGEPDKVTLSPPPDTRIPKGATLLIEDRRPEAEDLTNLKQDYFLGIAGCLIGTSHIPQPVESWQTLAMHAPVRTRILDGLRRDWRSRATVTVDGEDIFPGRILFADGAKKSG